MSTREEMVRMSWEQVRDMVSKSHERARVKKIQKLLISRISQFSRETGELNTSTKKQEAIRKGWREPWVTGADQFLRLLQSLGLSQFLQ